MVLPIAAVLGEMLVTCGDYMEPQLHSFKKFSEELGKLLRGSLPLWAKSITRMPLHAKSLSTYTYRHWNITEDAQSLCGALCREATKEANSTEESTQVVDQSGFHWVKIVVPVHMPGKPLAFIGNPRRAILRRRRTVGCRGFSITGLKEGAGVCGGRGRLWRKYGNAG